MKYSSQLHSSVMLFSACSMLMVCLFAADQVQSTPFSFNDCMKNPFASGCRGISAKRSAGPSALNNGNGNANKQLWSPRAASGPYGADLLNYYSALVAELVPESILNQERTEELLNRFDVATSASGYPSLRPSRSTMDIIGGSRPRD